MSEIQGTAAAALIVLNERASKRGENLNAEISMPDHDDSDAENGSECLVLDYFYNMNGKSSIVQKTNITSVEFLDL